MKSQSQLRTPTQTLATRKRKRILLVDDHPLVRHSLALWIERAPELEVCGQAESAAEALSMAARLKPDFVLTDVSMPGRNGLELIKDLRALHPDIQVLVLSMHDESLYAGRALRAGARGYITKRAGADGVVGAIREVMQGRIALSPAMATQLLEQFSGREKPPGDAGLPNLTDREIEVLDLVGQARSNREIADQLNISHKTVESHRLSLMRKLKVKTPAELLRLAVQQQESEQAAC